MNMTGVNVVHKVFGAGSIISHDDNHLIISFANEEKRFVYPDAFKEFISASDQKIDAAIKKEIALAEEGIIAAIESEKAKEILCKEEMQIKQGKNSLHSDNNDTRVRQYFFVFQNKSFEAERRGGYLWAPQTTMGGRTASHWKLMQIVRKGDVIFHSVHKNIAAISIATSDCYAAIQPPELKREEMWDDDGWRVDCQYITILKPIITSDYKQEFLELQPKQNAPFNKLGRGNTGYLFASNYELSKFLLKKLLKQNISLVEFEDKFGLDEY